MREFNYKLIPRELQVVKNWCCFKLEKNATRNKIDKIPYNPITNKKAKSNDKTTWCDFNDCLLAYENGEFDGLGFFFSPPFFGVDIDNIDSDIERFNNGITEDNVVYEFIHMLQSYAEYSVSKKGIHIICKGVLPQGRRRKNNVEMYSEGRFFAMTGDSFEEYEEVRNGTEEISFLHAKYLGKQEEITPIQHNVNAMDLNIHDILVAVGKSIQADKFKKLYNGNWQDDYESQSNADMAFASMLAFWCACDFSKMDTIFRNSKLYRNKYDEKRGEYTYGEKTLQTAIQNCTDIFQPTNENEYTYIIENMQDKTVHSFDDTGNAQRFVNAWGRKVKYIYEEKQWYIWDDEKWTPKEKGKIRYLVDNVVNNMPKELSYIYGNEDNSQEEMAKAFKKHLKSTRSSKGKDNMLKESQHLLADFLENFDQRPSLFNVKNGIINLKTGELLPHDRMKMLTKISNVEYTNNIDCPKWQEFLNDIFKGDEEIIQYIQKAVGYSLHGENPEQCMFILWGNGRNGKSVFLDIIKEIYGSYAMNMQAETLMVKKMTTGANPEIARLKGARLVTTSESNEGYRLNESMIKQLTGQDMFTVRGLYSSPFDFKPEFKIWMATNHKPIIRGTDLGIWRRLHLIPFTYTVPDEKKDINLSFKLKKELRGILNWAVEGYLLYQKYGLQLPKAMEKSLNDYRQEMDVVSLFLEECCIEDKNSEYKASLLYNHYKVWAKQNEQYVMSSSKFGAEISKRYEKVRKTAGICYIGIKSNYDFLKEYNIID